MPNAVLGVSGSVAAYRACDLARELMRRGFTVRVCLTDGAQKFVSAALFEALTGQPCLIDAFEEPERGRMAHIDWARQADVLVIAPATANAMNKLAAGIADDMLSTIALAFDGPWVIAPAMNPTMYASEPVQAALETLRARAAAFVEPDSGEVACGEQGQGKFAAVDRIADVVAEITARAQLFEGKHVVITSGPTQEPIDGVRYLSNRSSGKMGAALARAAFLMGARVTVVSGPSQIPTPIQATTIRVQTALEMRDAALSAAKDADLIIGAAAVADYRPEHPAAGKMRRSQDALDLRLIPNPDIIAELASQAKEDAMVVGFAAEPTSDLAIAKEKVVRKRLHAIAANDVSVPGLGFGSDRNAVTLVFADGRVVESGVRSKLGCSIWLLEQLVVPR
ncbi:MAG: bifunctional phosphopantothenoylcysteine decarboxylase/phosphopantothenate--cysteine ligase CoaBC [Fimbriimonadaceae bacterium]|nr:bifunctional phosphopantothenoylcysteine decarboxylase/phosphopantothenate--cysteine ligase CoaBC [Fimbriimonadaceae bacterium]